MPIVLKTEKVSKVADVSSTIQSFDTQAKKQAQYLLSRFDFERKNTREGINHYPLDSLCEDTPEDLVKELENISSALWFTVKVKIDQAISDSGIDFDYGDSIIGKITACGPNRFYGHHMKVDSVQPHAFTYTNKEGKLEIMAEINFGVEIY